MILSRLCRSLLAGLLFVTAAFADTRDEVMECIKRYNQALIKASAERGFGDRFEDKERLRECAGDEVAQKLFVWIASWHENGLYMEANVSSVEMLDFVEKDDSAVVTTKERWSYTYKKETPAGTMTAHPLTRVEYEVRYRLKKSPSGWQITDIKVLSERSQNPQSRSPCGSCDCKKN